MKRLLGCVVLGCGLAIGQSGAIVHILAGPLQLGHLPRVTRGVDSMPVVMSGPAAGPEVAARINTALRRLDAKVKEAASGCGDARNKGDWQRSVEVTLRGPRYLSVTATDDTYCGGAHPNEDFLPLVYDLNSGGTVNWLKLLPPGATSGVDDAADGSKVGAVIWPVLTAMGRKQAEKDCVDAFSTGEEVTFVLWLDARAGAIKAQPNGFPHALTACAVPVVITVDQARQMGGFNADLLDALEAAHKLQH